MILAWSGGGSGVGGDGVLAVTVLKKGVWNGGGGC